MTGGITASHPGALSGPRHPDDEWLSFYLADRVRARSGAGPARIYAPLGVGHHVDHMLAFDVGRLLQWVGEDVLFYEDFPYVLIEGAYERRLAELDLASEEVHRFSQPCLAAKIDAFGYYRSQLATVFPDDPGGERAMRERAAEVSGSQECRGERYWRMSRR